MLILNGDIVGRGSSLYEARQDARANGFTMTIVPTSDLANGRKSSEDKHGVWEWR